MLCLPQAIQRKADLTFQVLMLDSTGLHAISCLAAYNHLSIMRYLPILTALALSALAPAQAQQQLIPKPQQLEITDSLPFTINAATCIYLVNPSEKLQSQGKFLQELLSDGTGLKLALKQGALEAAPKNSIVLKQNGSIKKLGTEAYKMTANAQNIQITAPTIKGIFYGVVNIMQLLPTEFHQEGSKAGVVWKVGESGFKIVDAPRFGWRGFMLDEARHFFGEKAVKQILDQMALLKMNIFHWSLTNDAGWRIEIKKYPRLAQIGGTRRDSEVGTWKSGRSAGKPHSGYYTQEQIKRIVKYAEARGITIVPEFNIPGHSGASATAYPYLSLKSPKETPTTFIDNVALDPTKESTYEFVSNVLDEYIALFPGPFIHFGGDEVRYNQQWRATPKNKNPYATPDYINTTAQEFAAQPILPEIQEFMKKHKLKNLGDVQMYFSNRVAKMITDKGRRPMGWNEIYGHDVNHDGGGTASVKLDKNAVIHLWKGDWGLARQAIREGYSIVNGYCYFTYLDYGYNNVTLDKAYGFNPVIEGLTEEEANNVFGVNCQMWTEWTPTLERMHYMAFPRTVAYAEVGWTQPQNKNYASFKARLKDYTKIMDARGMGYNKDAATAYARSEFAKYPVLGKWSPADFGKEYSRYDATPHIKMKGDYKVVFFYDKGAEGGSMKGVALYANGKQVAKDMHQGFSGHAKRDIEYTLSLPKHTPGTKYEVRVIYEGKPKMDSHGTLFITAPEVL